MAPKLEFSDYRKKFKKALGLSTIVKAPILVECRRCHGQVPSDMKWSCAYCGFDNERAELYSFLNKCQKCEREPEAVACCHCGAIVSDEVYAPLAARAITEKKKRPPKKDPRVVEQREHEDQKRKLERSIEIAQLRGKLAQVESAAQPRKAATDEDKLDSEITDYVARIMGHHKAVAKAKLQADEDFKDDPDGLEKVIMALEQWREVHTQL